MKAFINWSGGKDAAFALYRCLQRTGMQVDCLLTNVTDTTDRIAVHDVHPTLLEQQAAAIGLPLQTVALPEQPNMLAYENAVQEKFLSLHQQGFRYAIFGDIFLEDLKHYREELLGKAGLECIFPLWGCNTTELLQQFITLGFKAIIVSVNDRFLNKSFCGRVLNEQFLNELPAGVDPCGENGEFHTFVFDGPIFKQPVAFKKGNVVHRTYKAPQTGGTVPVPTHYGFYFCDLLPM
jgi:uncharacterized protein (TIGR00290 family)